MQQEKRENLPKHRTWDLSGFFGSQQEIEDVYVAVKEAIPHIQLWENEPLTEENVIDLLRLQSEAFREAERLYVYAALIRDQDTREPQAQSEKERAEMLLVELQSACAFVSPSLTELPITMLENMIADAEYQDFSTYLTEIVRTKRYILSTKEENILSQISSFTKDFRNIFSMLDNADLRFGKVETPEETVELTHGGYALLLQHPDQSVRKSAFETYFDAYIKVINTIAATYAGNVKKNCAISKIRGYKSAMQRALYSEGIEEKVYKNLTSAVKKNVKSLHQYVALRKKELKLKELHMYDMHVPIVPTMGLTLAYEDAYQLVTTALEPLGETYCNLLKLAYKQRWIDVDETAGKRSGAYSWGCYDSNPVVLLNYKQTTHDIFTIAHEMGHALHTYFSNNAQCYEKAGYTIFLAEIASTVNEVLLLKHLLKTAHGNNEKYLLSYYLDMFRTTLFRQTMFAEFEMFAHAEVERGVPLTAKSLSEHYLSLNKTYYGKSVVHDEQIASEWARIPHFYNAFYVYKYATGLTAAVNIANKILKKEEGALENYLKFLTLGGSGMPLDLLAVAGVDLTKTEPFEFAMQEFRDTLAELKEAIKWES